MSEDSAKKMKQGAGKRLNDKQRIEIIQLADNSKISKRQLADKYGVSEAAIRKLLLKKDDFLKRYYDTPEEIRGQRLRGKNLRLDHEVDNTGAALHGAVGSAIGGAAGGLGGEGDAVGEFARLAGMHLLYPKSVYPTDEPWKHGLPALAGKLAPFMKSFLQVKPSAAAADGGAAAGAAGVGPIGIEGIADEAGVGAPPMSSIDWIGFARMLRDIRRAFHRYPEVGLQEVRTQAFIRKFCETCLRIPGKNIQVMAGTGLCVDICYENATITANDKRKLPVLAFRADMDALPIEEQNDHLPYCSTQKKHRKETRKRKKRKSTSGSGIKVEDMAAAAAAGLMSEDAAAAAALDMHPLVGDPANITTDGSEKSTEMDGVVNMEPPSTGAAFASTTSPTIDLDDGDDDPSVVIPPCAHMCGHDGHMVMVLGLATLVVRHAHLLPRDTFVRFVFQPAEEGPGGAQKMIEEGCLEEVDEIYGLHNAPFPLYSVHVRPGPVMAHESVFSIEINGVGGHGSAPHECVDPILTGAMVVTALQSIVSRTLSPTDSAVVSVTQFHGGETNNAIPSRATLVGTIRDFDLEVAETIKQRMEKIVHATCAAMGATAQVSFDDGYAPTINPYEETRIVQQIAMDIGLYVSEEGLPLMAAEDFSYYLQARKGCFFFLGTKEDQDDDKTRGLHSDHFDFNDKAIPLGIRIFLGILQNRFQCALYSVEDLQEFQVAMERIAG